MINNSRRSGRVLILFGSFLIEVRLVVLLSRAVRVDLGPRNSLVFFYPIIKLDRRCLLAESAKSRLS